MVWTAAMGVDEAEMLAAEGSDIMNGRAGDVKLKQSGSGSTAVACAYSEIVSSSDETPNFSRVMRSEIEGNGALGLGNGSPGNGGTSDCSIRNVFNFTMSNAYSSSEWLCGLPNVVDQAFFSNYYQSASHPV